MHSQFSKLFFICIAWFIISCEKDNEEMNIVPEISFSAVNTTSLVQYSSPLEFTISYQDGDGDLGENVDGVHNLFVKDVRNGLVYPYRISSLSPPGNEKVAIKGTLKVKFEPVALTDSVNAQTAVFEIYLTDRAGHVSNTVSSPSITVTR